MSLDLNKLENKLDEALSNETSETLTKFLNDKRMTNNKQSIFNRILNWFKLKCPDCKSSLYQEERGWFNKINIYHCTKCKKQWI